MFGNPLLKDGDTVIMDNYGFHHARHVKLVLRNMLAIRGVSLIYQPPYHPQFNTCKLCFRHLHSPIQILQFPIVLVQLLLEYPKISSNFTAIPYLPVYKSIPCISRPPILEPKNKFFLFLCKNFLEKLLFYLRISFQIHYGFMKKTTASLDVQLTISLT